MKIVAHTTTELRGEATPPSSKSHTIRGLILGTLAKGTSTLLNPLKSQDTEDAIEACRTLGADITVKEDRIIIESNGLPIKAEGKVNTGNSGVTTHFLMPVMGLRGSKAGMITFDCGAQMKERPITSLVQALRNLGLSISASGPERLSQSETRAGKGRTTDVRCPLRITGELKGGRTEVNGENSQYLSSLLISLPCAPNDSVVMVNDLKERPYVGMTESWLKEQGIVYTHEQKGELDSRFRGNDREGEEKVERKTSHDVYTIKGGQSYKPFTKTIPGDFSSASYLIAAGALFDGEVILHGLDMGDPQGDKALVEILKEMGADIEIGRNKEISGNRLTIKGGKALKGIRIDANAIPDLVPTLAVIGTQAKGKTEIYNVGQARIKETDRLHSMTEGLTTMGAKITETQDGLTIAGGKLYGGKVHGFHDHRTVMALTLAGMLADGETWIDTAESIQKTFPAYVTLMRKLGAKLTMR